MHEHMLTHVCTDRGDVYSGPDMCTHVTHTHTKHADAVIIQAINGSFHTCLLDKQTARNKGRGETCEEEEGEKHRQRWERERG